MTTTPSSRPNLKSSLLFLFLFLGLSCGNFSDIPKELNGNWESARWVINKTGEQIAGQIAFHFDSTGHYEVDYGTEKERGIYSVEGDRLYTTENGQARKYVKIIKLTADSLILGMNRSGRLETIFLIKK